MELKVFSPRHPNRALAFQSHLYGIESMSYVFEDWYGAGFNRTFMELKAIVNIG